MKKEIIKTYLPVGVLTGVTIASGMVLASGGARATVSCSTSNGQITCTDSGATATVTVSAGCTLGFSGTSNTSYTTTLVPTVGGTATTESISAKPNMAISCNDSGGWALYADGYSPATAGGEAQLGQTALRGTSTGLAIATGTSGTSSRWAFKLTLKSGTASIASGYTSYTAVPSSYTKVASVTSATAASTAQIRADYQVYMSTSQAADTYTGGVKYSLVHPSTASRPTT